MTAEMWSLQAALAWCANTLEGVMAYDKTRAESIEPPAPKDPFEGADFYDDGDGGDPAGRMPRVV